MAALSAALNAVAVCIEIAQHLVAEHIVEHPMLMNAGDAVAPNRKVTVLSIKIWGMGRGRRGRRDAYRCGRSAHQEPHPGR